ncbi:unnamed protein product [Paramecium pentaurelia]|uniref:Uncharacterized protein n=1 Tax=Paramecium pentaurelia TaxID=43138 RepID=A0A8S1SFP3_9CILI|nr:unnamed protein product [Paramecium pentaurelia]
MQDSEANKIFSNQEKSKLYKWRWVVLILFTMAVFMNSIPGEIYVPASNETQLIYSESETMITLAQTSYVIMHPILSIPCSQFIVKYGWAKATNIGVALTIGGSLIKLLVNQTGFYIIVIGQALIGAGKPFILNAQASMAQNWFYPESRPSIIIALNVLNLISNVVTLMIPGKWIFRNYDFEDTEESIQEGKELVNKLNSVCLYMVLTLIPCLFFLRSTAPTPPSELVKKEEKTANTKKTILKILSNHNFQCCLLAYSVYLGLVKCLVLILPYLFKPAGYGKGEVSIAGSIAMASAAMSQSTLAAFIQEFKNVKTKLIKILMVISTGSLAVFYFSLLSRNLLFIYLANGLVGFFIMPIAPVLMDISCDLIFPISPSYAIGIMYIGSQILLVIFTQIEAVIVGGANSTMTRVTITLMLDVGLQLLGLFLFSFIRIKKGRVSESTHSIVPTDVQESLVQGRSLFEKGQAFSSSYVGSSFFNAQSSIAFVGITPTAPYTDYQKDQKQAVYTSEIMQWQNSEITREEQARKQ